jgi:predicted RNA binding protein YcfA (HicA-like mRNA interferase family)
MSSFPSTKTKRVLGALVKIGWTVKRQTGSHKVLQREGYDDFVFAFHQGEEIGSHMLQRIAKNRINA